MLDLQFSGRSGILFLQLDLLSHFHQYRLLIVNGDGDLTIVHGPQRLQNGLLRRVEGLLFLFHEFLLKTKKLQRSLAAAEFLHQMILRTACVRAASDWTLP